MKFVQDRSAFKKLLLFAKRAAVLAVLVWSVTAGQAFAQSSTPADAVELVRRGSDLRQRWQIDAAERTYLEALKTPAPNFSALLGLAEISRVKMDYQRAVEYLERAEKCLDTTQRVDELALLNAFGQLYLTLEDAPKAAGYFDRMLALDPTDPRGTLGKAAVALLDRNYDQSEVLLQRLLARKNCSDPAAYTALAKLYLEQNRYPQAAAAAQRALDLDTFNVEAMGVLCSVKVVERRPDAVRKLAQTVVELNPYSARMRRLLSQYVRSRKSFPLPPAPAQQAFEQAVEFSRQGRIALAKTGFEKAVSLHPRFIQALIGLGAVSIQLGDLDEAVRAAETAVQLDPDNSLAQLQLSIAHIERHERGRIAAGANVVAPSFDAAKPTDVGEVFVNYYSLSPDQQRIIDTSVAPFAHFLPELKKRGAKHYLLPLDRQLAEVPGYESLDDRTTFDGRYYASIRGVGGLVTVSGMEYLGVVAGGGFNTIAHEFAHQIHSSLLDKPTVDRIQTLYSKAVREGRTLDYYAAANEWEYFAQGYEAYISTVKRPGLGVTGRHTRDELKRLDPALYALIDELAHKTTH